MTNFTFTQDQTDVIIHVLKKRRREIHNELNRTKPLGEVYAVLSDFDKTSLEQEIVAITDILGDAE